MAMIDADPDDPESAPLPFDGLDEDSSKPMVRVSISLMKFIEFNYSDNDFV